MTTFLIIADLSVLANWAILGACFWATLVDPLNIVVWRQERYNSFQLLSLWLAQPRWIWCDLKGTLQESGHPGVVALVFDKYGVDIYIKARNVPFLYTHPIHFFTFPRGKKKLKRCKPAIPSLSPCTINQRPFRLPTRFFLHTSHPGNPRAPGVG